MVGDALSRVGENNCSFTLVPSDHGKFHIRIDGELVASHQHLPDAHVFPDLHDLIEALNERIGS